MPKYEGPNTKYSEYDSKFIRVENDIFTTDPKDTDTGHDEYVIAQGILGLIQQLSTEKPESVDAGYLTVLNNEKVIYLFKNS